MKTVGFYPYPIVKGNDYTDLIIESIRRADSNIAIEPFSHHKIILKGKKYDVVWLNWFETLSNNFFSFSYELLSKLYIIKYLKLKNVKIITVFHDRVPHDTKHGETSKWFLKFLLNNSDTILVLNEASRDIIKEYIGEKGLKKTFKLPHPVYALPDTADNDFPSDFNVLFFGGLKPYKNIEMLIELAKLNPQIKFKIGGKPINKKYGEELERLCRDVPNITLIPKKLSESELQRMVKESMILVLPYKLKSSLNSGVMIYAFTHKRNVIIPRIAAINEFKNQNDIYWYEYDTDKEHLEILDRKLKKAYEEYKNNPELFRSKVENLHEEVKKYTVDYLGEIIKDLQIL